MENHLFIYIEREKYAELLLLMIIIIIGGIVDIPCCDLKVVLQYSSVSMAPYSRPDWLLVPA